MNDSELLKLAAKAAGQSEIVDQLTHSDLKHCSWNPLTDDGDALRLAVNLNLLWKTDVHYSRYIDLSKLNDCENTRCAIVLAAAEIGKKMP